MDWGLLLVSTTSTSSTVPSLLITNNGFHSPCTIHQNCETIKNIEPHEWVCKFISCNSELMFYRSAWRNNSLYIFFCNPSCIMYKKMKFLYTFVWFFFYFFRFPKLYILLCIINTYSVFGCTSDLRSNITNFHILHLH